MTNQQGKPDAGKPHVRFDEGEASRPGLGGNLSTLLENNPFTIKLFEEPFEFRVSAVRGMV